MVKNLPGRSGDTGLILVEEWSRERNDNLLQYSCLENPMDRGARQAIIHRVAKSLAGLSDIASMHAWGTKVPHAGATKPKCYSERYCVKEWRSCMLQLRPTAADKCSVVSNSCDPMDYSPPGSSVHRISPARILEWVAISFSRKTRYR